MQALLFEPPRGSNPDDLLFPVKFQITVKSSAGREGESVLPVGMSYVADGLLVWLILLPKVEKSFILICQVFFLP